MKHNHRTYLVVLAMFAILLSACAGAPAAAPAEREQAAVKVNASLIAYTGTIDSMEGDQWIVNGQPLTVDPTVIQDGPFQVGDTIKVEGDVNLDGTFTVTRVEMPTVDDLAQLPQVGDPATDGNANDANTNDANSNDANSNDANGNDDNSNDINGNSNDDNSNDINGNSNDDDDNGNSNSSIGNSNDDDDDDDSNSNSSSSGNSNSHDDDDDDDHSSGSNGNGDDHNDDHDDDHDSNSNSNSNGS